MDKKEQLKDVKDPAHACEEVMAEDPMFWVRFVRRHNANVIDALFLDRDFMKEDEVTGIVGQVAAFFGLPAPVIRSKADSIAEVMLSEDADNCELAYNWQLMDKAGINNRDALRLAFVHEMAHQYNRDKRFLLFENELWVQELAADMLVGGFSVLNGDVATGKYKYMVSSQKATLTHPDGNLRKEIVDFGRTQTEKLLRGGRYTGVKDLLEELPLFVYGHYGELQRAWDDIDLMEELTEKTAEPPKPIDYDSLPDTNLLKQYYLRHKKEFEERKKKDDEQE